MKDFLEIVQKRKSIRSFADTEVSRETIRKILECAIAAPTNCNQQRWNFIVVDEVEKKEQLIKMAASNTMFRRAPVVIAVTYDGWSNKEAIQGASLAVGHILLAAEYYGLNGLPMNSYGGDKRVKQVLGIPPDECICCFVALGYPDERAKNALPVPRRPLDEVLHWNQFETRLQPAFTYDPNDWTLEGLKQHHQHYCRKTFMGKEMDLAGSWERELVRLELSRIKGPIIDLFSYDGSYLSLFPDSEVTTFDTTKETAAYTGEAASLVDREVTAHVYEPDNANLTGQPARSATLIFKAERLPDSVLEDVLVKAYSSVVSGGELVIIARTKNIFFRVFFFLIPLVFGKDVRKTGIYTFFGPYQPVKIKKVLQQVERAGFEENSWAGYFAFPAFLEQIYQMIAQYIKSEGSSYLHRERRVDWISKSIDAILKWQGTKRVGILGSVVVITCKKT